MEAVNENFKIPYHMNLANRTDIDGFVCIQQKRLLCKGIFNGDNPFKFVAPVFLAQLALGSFLTSACQFLLRPLGQADIVGQILGGIIAGPSLLGQNKAYMDTIFPKKSLGLLETLSLFSCMMFLFLVGVRMDMDVVMRSGSKEWAIGILTFFLPQLLTVPVSHLLHDYARKVSQVENEEGELTLLSILASMTSFHVVACVLHDLKLLNSEIGRIASSSSMISGILCWFFLTIGFTVKQYIKSGLGLIPLIIVLVSMFASVIIMFYAIRPLLSWMIRRTPEGKPLKEIYVVAVILLFLFCCFLGQIMGQYPFFLPMALGLIIPDGPPLGSTVVDRIDCFVLNVLLPLYFLLNGGEVNLSGLNGCTWSIVVGLNLLATLGKFIATMLPCLYFQMPFRDSLALAFILSSVGLVDLLSYTRALQFGYISNPSFSIVCIMAAIITGVISFTVKYLYDPSRRYVCYRRRTIQHNNSELRILVCINNQESVPTILNVLEASNPTRESPLGVYVLHLFELVGRASPLLVAHQDSQRKMKTRGYQSRATTHTERIINCFKVFENNNQGIVFVQSYTCIAPYTTMHEDICTISLDKYTSLLILPFHKFWSSEGVMVESAGLRNVNRQVLARSPCSVAILVDLGAFGRPRSIHESWSFYRIGVIFLGGPDDREALAYATRMSAHPNVKLTVVRLVESNCISNDIDVDVDVDVDDDVATDDDDDDDSERKLDVDLINEFRVSNAHVGMGSNRVTYTEEVITDGMDISNVIRSVMDDSYDLILAGRRHESVSNFFQGIKEPIKFPELGCIGDMLASNGSRSTVSVLVVQQHTIESAGQIPDKEGQCLKVEISNRYSIKGKKKHIPEDIQFEKREL
ncbi:cation/H(+) antiporter 15-like [Macadamia integrifolia]|uniref:cation/H(+) antiporter 15-like n=1 Tax=Macadamia integrifolia TaxID=60698 RepID=UPI001C529802|nr:cation/H(+) antiporter 15-like [Macadamia integrifolia]